MKNDLLLIVDGNSILNRSYYAIPHMNNSDGVPTSGVYGFLNTILNFVDNNNPSHVCVAFDKGRATFRHQLCDSYKCNRNKMEDNLYSQLKLVQKILGFMNIIQLSDIEYEADDIIGTVSRICDEVSMPCIMISGDRDLLQLVSKNTQLNFVSTRTGKTITKNYDLDSVIQDFEILPFQFVDLKALSGDKSDNISGVPGIGEKTALDLVKKYHNLDNIYANLEQLKPSVQKKLSLNMDSAYKSYQLAKIYREISLNIPLDEMKIAPLKVQELQLELEYLEMKNIIRKFESRNWNLVKH